MTKLCKSSCSKRLKVSTATFRMDSQLCLHVDVSIARGALWALWALWAFWTYRKVYSGTAVTGVVMHCSPNNLLSSKFKPLGRFGFLEKTQANLRCYFLNCLEQGPEYCTRLSGVFCLDFKLCGACAYSRRSTACKWDHFSESFYGDLQIKRQLGAQVIGPLSAEWKSTGP